MSEFKRTLNVLEQLTSYWTSPLEWNSRQGKVLYCSSRKKLLPWLIVLLFCGIQVTTCCLVLGLQFFGMMHLPMMNILFAMGLCGFQAFTFFVEVAKLLCGKMNSQVFGELLVLDGMFKKANFVPLRSKMAWCAL